MAKVSQKKVQKSQTEVSVSAHPERLLILGGAWLAMVTMGFMGVAAIVNPEARLPVIDPLLEAIARSKQQQLRSPQDTVTLDTIEHVNFVSTYMVDESYLVDLTVKPSQPAVIAEPINTAAVVQDVETGDPVVVVDDVNDIAIAPLPLSVAPSAENAPSSSPAALPRKNRVPIWVYWSIFLSCSAGSAMITVLLYRLTRPLPSAAALNHAQTGGFPKGRKKVRRPKTKGSVQAHSRPIAQAKVHQPIVPVPVPVAKFPVAEVPAIAPLQISMPDQVEPPQLHIEPIVDPQPVPTKKSSRADKLAQLAERVKEQPPKRLVEMMDIRRRNHLAPFS